MEIPEGVILFEGDIGSGKSTLLYAVEFALFGFSDMKGSHLLSEGKREGRVRVAIEVAGVEYVIERSLKARKEDVVQEECFISSKGERVRLSASDLKERIISILGYNEPTHPKAESLVYRYAVFTPQEQMKEILTQNAENRLHVVRRVLGAQSYQVAAENSVLVERKLSRMSYGLAKASEDLEEKRGELKERRDEASRLRLEIPQLESAVAEAERVVTRYDEDWKELLKKREGLVRVFGKVEPLQDSIAETEELLNENEAAKIHAEERLAEEVFPVISRFESSRRPERSSKEIQKEKDGIQERLYALRASIETLNSELVKDRDLVAQGVCPKCGQRLPESFALRLEHADGELARLGEDAKTTTGALASIDEQLTASKEFDDLEKEYARASKEKSRAEKEVDSLRVRIDEERRHLDDLRAKLAEAQSHGAEIDSLTSRIDELEVKLHRARTAKQRADEELTRTTEHQADVAKETERLSKEVAKKERDSAQARRLTSYQDWLGSFFRPTVSQIETETLSQAAANFNAHFQRFFTTLVDDPDMLVRVKEDFSPVFEREGFEQDYEALSGGERTSMALAYRFALNAVIRDDLASQPELIVLDEPTDGFSREQVYRMRALLEELGSRQVILVSHEKELESMADHIFRVEKRSGSSSVSRVTD